MRIIKIIFTIIFTIPLHCMLKFPNSISIISHDDSTIFICEHDTALEAWRKSFKDIKTEQQLKTILNTNKDIQIIDDRLEANQPNYVCFQFAMEKITGSRELAQTMGLPGTCKENFKWSNFFEHTNNYQTGDLAIYDVNKHFAYVLNETHFLSKIGHSSISAQHLPSHTPKPYGDSFIVSRLLPQYRNNKELLQQDLEKEIKKTEEKKEQQKLAQLKKTTQKWLASIDY